jgi:glycosyltransferase involved in cell wall biosynthesis
MFMAADLTNLMKGSDIMIEALRGLPASLKADTVMLLLGHKGAAFADALDIPTINLGYIESDHHKAVCYSAADLFLHPTRADVFPYVLLESMACGTPVVSFRVGGVPDAVRQGITGCLAEPERTEEFRAFIVQLLEDEQLRINMGMSSRDIALEEYTLDLQVRRFIDLCSTLKH